MSFVIDIMNETDWDEVRSIYLEGIATGQATFETTAPDWKKWDADHLDEPRLVCRQDETVVGWAALSHVSGRCVYAVSQK
jgi:L-amino acid N-acyltransferase YncA